MQTPFHAFVKARELENSGDLLAVYASSNIEVFPYQIAAAQFALRSPYLRGVILCDEGALGKSYEAMLVAVQKWYEGAKVAVIVTTPLLMQWQRLIEDKFTVPLDELHLMTYDDAVVNADSLTAFDVVVFDEAHYLRNYETQRAATLKSATASAFKILLTATPMQNSIMDLYGLIHFIDETVLPNPDEFYRRYYRKPENYHELSDRVSKFCFRTTRAQVEHYTKIPRRIPITVEYEMSAQESALYGLVEKYLSRESKAAFPDMDEHRLSLRMHRSLSSSTAALVKFLTGVENRLEPGEERDEITAMLELARSITKDAKAAELVRALKAAFPEIRKLGANKKALIFTESRDTQKYIAEYLTASGFDVLTYNGDKTREYEIIDKFQTGAQILVATDIAAEGFNLEFCSLVVNYDLPYNALEIEQRINRCHRQGQENDVIVLSFLDKENYGDVRTLEIARKRLEQYQGIIGMSDQIFGNFGADVSAAIRANARHKADIQREFEQILLRHRDSNEALVDAAESVLFTSFTSEVAKSVVVTPKYIDEKIHQMNNDLWEITAPFLAERGYVIDEAARTATLPDDAEPPHLFYYWTGSRNKPYIGMKKYGLDKNFKPASGRVTLSSPIGRGVIEQIECSDNGVLTIDGQVPPCKIGFYTVNVGNMTYTTFTGKADNGQPLTEDECRRIMTLPVLEYEEQGKKTAAWLRNSTGGLKRDELDSLIPSELFIARQLENRTSAQNEEISRMREANNRKKADLERHLNAVRADLKAAQSKPDKDLSRHDSLRAQRETAQLLKRVKDIEKSLHYDKMRLEQELKAEVESFLGKSKLTVQLHRQFIIRVSGKDEYYGKNGRAVYEY